MFSVIFFSYNDIYHFDISGLKKPGGQMKKNTKKTQTQQQGKLVCKPRPPSVIFLNDRTKDVNALNIDSSAVFEMLV